MSTPELAEGAIVDGRYRIERRLGRGGMGSVYEALQIKLQRLVALKVLRPEFAEQELAARRFEREAKAASAIDHRNVVKILDFGQLDTSECYYTMELLKGRDLAQVLRQEGAVPWPRAGWILLQLVRAFAAVHAQGIIHRDIKPANCFLLDPKPGDEPDLVKILDFGIANVQNAKGATALTGAHDIIGTALYMAPEQILSGQVDARTDIYAFGVMMYELLTGVVPFPGDNPFAVMTAHQRDIPVPPRVRQPSIPPAVEAIVLTALAKDPATRFASMLDVEVAMIPHVFFPAAMGTMQPPATETPRAPKTDRYGQVPGTSPGPQDWSEVTSRGPSGPRTETARRGRSRGQGWIAGTVMLALASLGAGGVWLWARSRTPMPSQPSPMSAVPEPIRNAAAEPTPSAPSAASEVPARAAPPPPERQYDPFADPFGGPPPSTPGSSAPPPQGEERDGETFVASVDAIDLEALLPSESWAASPGGIGGLVSDPSGRAIGGAGVCAWLVDPRAPLELRRKPRCVRTNPRGRYRLTELPPSVYDVSIFAEGYLPQSSGDLPERGLLLVRPDETRSGISFAMEAGGRAVTGVVHDAEGVPIEGARVAAIGLGRALAVTDARGAFSLWLPVGEVALVVWAGGYTDVVRHGDGQSPFDIELRREAVLVGKVVWEDTREPGSGARVRPGTSEGGIDPVVYADADGLFTIPALPAGAFAPTARVIDGFGQATTFRLEEGTISPEIIVELQRAALPVEEVLEPVAEVPPAVEVPPPAAAVSPVTTKAPTDGDIRRRLTRRLKKCGASGSIEVRAKYILESGALFVPEVRVSSSTAGEVKACAEAIVEKVAFSSRSQPAIFAPLVVKL